MLDRSFHVCDKGDSISEFYAFIKKTGLNFEITLLVIFTNSDNIYFDFIWDIYKMWLHRHMDIEIVQETIKPYQNK